MKPRIDTSNVPEYEAQNQVDLLSAFNRFCALRGKTSHGFDVGAITAVNQWALKYVPRCGWMIVSGLGGCGAAMTRFNGYIKDTWSMLIAVEMMEKVTRDIAEEADDKRFGPRCEGCYRRPNEAEPHSKDCFRLEDITA